MVRPITKTVSNDVTNDEIDVAMKKLRSEVGEKAALRAIERLLFIKMRLQGVEMSKAMAIMDITKPTAYQWQNVCSSDLSIPSSPITQAEHLAG